VLAGRPLTVLTLAISRDDFRPACSASAWMVKASSAGFSARCNIEGDRPFGHDPRLLRDPAAA
jgi:hypothetical protein